MFHIVSRILVHYPRCCPGCRRVHASVLPRLFPAAAIWYPHIPLITLVIDPSAVIIHDEAPDPRRTAALEYTHGLGTRIRRSSRCLREHPLLLRQTRVRSSLLTDECADLGQSIFGSGGNGYRDAPWACMREHTRRGDSIRATRFMAGVLCIRPYTLRASPEPPFARVGAVTLASLIGPAHHRRRWGYTRLWKRYTPRTGPHG
ncbi:hypothetical protein B0H19DRAFT_1250855 [Mycena capillaripes]|nr:hypothetical protein B0H19DRAFT_1250855 [Mycena capillaripes]